MLTGTAFAQETAAPAADASDAVLATSLTNTGMAEASLVSAVRDGDKLTVRVRFKATEGQTGTEVLYSSMSENSWQTDYYLVAGDKKYLILKDSAGKPLAPSSLSLNASNPMAGSWNATFPAPPAGETAMLHIGNVEPLGPFTVPE
ncbi:MAG: hypothetical protein DI498_01945 [Paracoccus denitrificans]|nr:MAG: hypothetical protein DI498_01945 [Paracoccus denitrificans]PZO85920.1 MAG: hypothetical protein DI633_01945 [Paracoccus denitrificans]